MTSFEWVFYALILIVQNIAFTFVSRSRNSGSLKRHLFASLASNSVWFTSQLVTVDSITRILKGQLGMSMAVFTAAFYTLFTVLGGMIAHWISLKTEKGKAAVGASKKYKQITYEEWAMVQAIIDPCKPRV